MPTALEHNRHAVLMSLIPAVPLVQVLGAAHEAHDQHPACLHRTSCILDDVPIAVQEKES